MEPLRLELDGEPTTVWLGWIGNGAYAPAGFAPSWRERLDDGLLDVRLVLGDRRFARTRLVAEVLVGRLRRCPVYREQRVSELDGRVDDRPAAPRRRRRDVRRRGALRRDEATPRPSRWPCRRASGQP